MGAEVGHHYEVRLGMGIIFMYNMCVYIGGVLGLATVATSPLVLAPAPTSGLIRLRSGHHYEVRLGLGIVFMYNMSIYEACLGRHFFRGLHAQKKKGRPPFPRPREPEGLVRPSG